jgi:hypothetical protein
MGARRVRTCLSALGAIARMSTRRGTRRSVVSMFRMLLGYFANCSSELNCAGLKWEGGADEMCSDLHCGGDELDPTPGLNNLPTTWVNQTSSYNCFVF